MKRTEHYVGTSENHESYKLDKTKKFSITKQPKVLLVSQCEIAFVVIMKKGLKLVERVGPCVYFSKSRRALLSTRSSARSTES